MKEVEIKNDRGEVINVIKVNETEDYAAMYRDARDKVAQMKECVRILSDIIEQQKQMQMPCSLNLISILATLDYCNRDSTDILIKPLAKACRKALHRNEVAMNNYYKLARHIIDAENA